MGVLMRLAPIQVTLDSGMRILPDREKSLSLVLGRDIVRGRQEYVRLQCVLEKAVDTCTDLSLSA